MADITILDYSSNPWYKGFKMAISVFDYNTNQWYVQHANGELEPCHNRATAEVLARRANEDLQVEADPQMDYYDTAIEDLIDNSIDLHELGLSGAPEVV